MQQPTLASPTARRTTFKLMLAGALPVAGFATHAGRAVAAPAAQTGTLQQHALGDATLIRIINPRPTPNPANPHVNSYLVVRGDEAALIDTGDPGSGGRVEEALASVGLAWRNLRHVILTHWHPDHAGSTPEILGKAPAADVWIGAGDVPLARNVATAAVRAVYEGDQVFGLQVVAMPGHSPGHINLVEPTTRSLFTGDSVFNLAAAWEQFNLPPGIQMSLPQFTWNRPLMLGSLRRLQDLEIDRAFFGHGSPLDSGAATELAKLPAVLPPR